MPALYAEKFDCKRRLCDDLIMGTPRSSSEIPVFHPSFLPAWAKLNTERYQEDSAFAAGAALLALSSLANSKPVYFGALAERLALRAAAGTSRLRGRPVHEDQIRDEWWLRLSNEALTPSGAHFAAWRSLERLRGGVRSLTPAMLEELARQFGQPLTGTADVLLEGINDRVSAIAHPPLAAAAAARAVYEFDPLQEPLSHFIADATLAFRLGWTFPLPLIATHIGVPALRGGGNQRRPIPADPTWPQAVTAACALSAPTVIHLAQELSLKASALLGFSPRLRAKPSQKVIEALLSHACVAGSRQIGGMSDRAMRRIYERLREAGIVRELTGRPTFRLYGL